MEHGSHQFPGGAHVQTGIRVQGNDVPGALQRLPVPRLHLQTGGPVLQQADQLEQGPPLPLPAHIPLVPGAELRPAEEEIEAPAVCLVQRLHRPFGAVFPDASLLPHGGPAVGQIGQDAKAQLLPRVPVGQAVPLQEGGQLGAAVRSGEQGNHDAKGPAFGGDSLPQLHPGHRTGRHQPDQSEIQGIFHNVGQGEQQKHGDGKGARPDPKRQGRQQGQAAHRPDIARPGRQVLSPSQGLAVEIPADVAPGAFPLPGQIQGAAGRLALLHTVPSGQTAYPLAVAAAAVLVHVGVVARGVLAQDGLHPAGILQHRPPVGGGQSPQGGKQRLKIPRVPFSRHQSLNIAAQVGQTLDQHAGQGGDHQGQLPLGQGPLPLERVQIPGYPPAVQVGGCPQQSLGAAPEQTAAPLRPTEGTAPAKGQHGLPPLPHSQIAVVQQPFHRRGQRGPSGAPLDQPAAARLRLYQGGADGALQLSDGDSAPRFQFPGRVHCMVSQMCVVHWDVWCVGHGIPPGNE